MGLWMQWRAGRDDRFRFLVALAAPTILMFTLLPIFGNLGLPHWAMPGWFLLMPLAGAWLAELAGTGRPARWSRNAVIGSLAALALLASHAATGWVTRLAPAFARSDPTLETFGWDQLGARLKEIGLDDPRRFIVADSWQNAGRMDVALEGRFAVMPGTQDPRHYAFNIDQRALIGRDALLSFAPGARRKCARAWPAISWRSGKGGASRSGAAGCPRSSLSSFPPRGLKSRSPGPMGSGDEPSRRPLHRRRAHLQ